MTEDGSPQSEYIADPWWAILALERCEGDPLPLVRPDVWVLGDLAARLFFAVGQRNDDEVPTFCLADPCESRHAVAMEGSWEREAAVKAGAVDRPCRGIILNLSPRECGHKGKLAGPTTADCVKVPLEGCRG